MQMRKTINKYVACVAVGLSAFCATPVPAVNGPDEGCPVSVKLRGHENTEWSRSYAYHLVDGRKNLPRVLLVGDSIVNGYEGEARRLLEAKGVNVTYWISSYCVTSPHYLTFLGIYLDEAKYDVIHFNNGLHSLDTPTADWEKRFEAALRLIREKQPAAKIVWCTSTPLKDASKTAKARELNAAGAKVVARLGDIETNDLFAALDPLERNANWSDTYHHKPHVCKMEGGLVAKAVLSAIDRKKASAQSAAIPRETMERIAREVATPYKFGMVIAPEKGEKLDGPMVFRRNGRWYMMYVRFDGRGYATMLADSDDLLTWRKLGCILPRGKAGDWDSEQADGVPLLLDPEWEGSNELKSFNGKYWMLYIGGSRKGYEPDPLSTGVAFTDDPAAAREWTRAKAVPALSPSDADARPFERKTIYKHYVVEDASRSLGARFVDYYNAKQKGEWHERIGMAVSDDLVNWRRYGDKPVIDDCVPGRAGISGDPMIRRIGDVWVMFYFGYNWRPGEKGAFDTFACSRDLVNWTKWTGEPLLRTSEPYDRVHAHKPWVIKHDGVVYHFYCAVGDSGRGLALATSRRISRP